MIKNVSVLGSTGSIGTQTLDVVERFPEKLSVCALSCLGRQPDLFAKQIAKFRPALAAVYDASLLPAVKEAVEEERRRSNEAFASPVFVTGMEGLKQAAVLSEADIVVTSLVGMIGIEPTLAAIEAGKDIALANKETLVCAGEFVKKAAAENHVRILPVDSEHGAIFQCLQGVQRHPVDTLSKIWLTASGGPFRGYSRAELEKVTLEQALHHPNWSMGAKITIDSATLMNKGLEMIEAKWLFDVDIDRVQPIIHPQSLVHSMVELTDGSVLAQLGPADMRLPIEVALLYPERGSCVVQPLDFRNLSALTFEEIDESVFPSTRMAREAARLGGIYPAVFNAADEIAVQRFRKGKIPFTGIFDLVDKALDKAGAFHGVYDLPTILSIRKQTENWI